MTSNHQRQGITGPRLEAPLIPHAEAFYSAYDLGPSLTAAIVRSGWRLSYFRPVPREHSLGTATSRGVQDWLIRARPPMEIADSFDLRVEVLFYVSEFSDLQARTVQRVREYVEHDQRASRDVAFLVTGDEEADNKIAQMPRSDGIVPLTWGWVRSAAGGGQGEKPLRARLEKFLYARDLFDVQVPVVGSRFFGRQTTLQLLKRNGLADQPVGVFGLRKIGKTSLLKAFVAESTVWVPGEPAILPVHVDLQAVPPGRRDQNFLLWEIGRRSLAVARSHPAARQSVIPTRLFGLETPPSASFDVSVDFDRELRAVIRAVADRTGEAHLVIVFDEIERLVPPGTAEPAFTGAVALLRYLRGLNQEGLTLSFVVAGANPYFAEQAEIAGQENPLLNFIVKHYLAPLSDDEARQMIQRLGGMMGVKFHHEAASAIVHHAGGHPFLTRQLCSVAIRRLPQSRPLTVGVQGVERALGDFSISQHHTFEQIFLSLADYPDEQFLLRQLARGDFDFVSKWSSSEPLGLEHLKGYGLIQQVGNRWEFTIPLLGEYIINSVT